jgi:hypothetical protein
LVEQVASSKPKSNLPFVIASIIVSAVGAISPFTFLNLIGILLAGFAIYRSPRSRGGWIALVLGVVLYVGSKVLPFL